MLKGIDVQTQTSTQMAKAGAEVVAEALNETQGNMLVFLPAAADIKAMARALEVRGSVQQRIVQPSWRRFGCWHLLGYARDIVFPSRSASSARVSLSQHRCA